MKKLILTIFALACAVAVSSCCDQSYCPGNLKCPEKYEDEPQRQEETPYRWDKQEKVPQGAERQHRRW